MLRANPKWPWSAVVSVSVLLVISAVSAGGWFFGWEFHGGPYSPDIGGTIAEWFAGVGTIGAFAAALFIFRQELLRASNRERRVAILEIAELVSEATNRSRSLVNGVMQSRQMAPSALTPGSLTRLQLTWDELRFITQGRLKRSTVRLGDPELIRSVDAYISTILDFGNCLNDCNKGGLGAAFDTVRQNAASAFAAIEDRIDVLLGDLEDE